MSEEQVSLGADADSNFAASGDSMGFGTTTDKSQPRVPTGPVNSDAKAYVSSTGDAAEETSRSAAEDGLTSYGNADTHAEAGAPGTDITGSSGYGSRKAPDAQPEQRLEGGLHRPEYLSKGEHIPVRMGIAPRTDAEAAATNQSRGQDKQLQGDYSADDVNAVQAKLEQTHGQQRT